jgi:hypothetical protein
LVMPLLILFILDSSPRVSVVLYSSCSASERHRCVIARDRGSAGAGGGGHFCPVKLLKAGAGSQIRGMGRGRGSLPLPRPVATLTDLLKSNCFFHCHSIG